MSSSTTSALPLVERLFDGLAAGGDRLAFEMGQERLTYRQLDEGSRRYAAGLRGLGLEPGDRVACLLGTSLELVVALLGHYRAGLIHVPINTRYGRVEIEHILQDSGARALLLDVTLEQTAEARALAGETDPLEHLIALGGPAATGETSFDQLAGARPLDQMALPSDDDLCLLIYTSGTTGRSKGASLSFSNVLSNIDALTQLWRWSVDDRLALALPLFHVHGLGIGVHGTLLRGCQTVLHRGFDARAVAREVGQGGATIFMGVPTMYARLLEAMEADSAVAEALRAARLFTSGSAALSADAFERFEALCGHRILERYGMSETMLTLSNPYEPARRRPGTIGFPVGDTAIRVVGDDQRPVAQGATGELQVRGSSVMQGYWQAPELTESACTNDGWFRTGDVVRIDEEGYVVHLGRASADIIKSGGYKIAAREIEEVLARHPDIEEIAVVGVPDEVWGEQVAAAVVPRQGAARREETEWLEALAETCRGELADYKRPRQVALVEALPRNALGKVQKHRLRERFS